MTATAKEVTQPRDGDLLPTPTPAPTQYNPLAIIDKAIERGVDPAQLEKLMDLQERWEKQRAKEAYAAAMNLCQRNLPVVVRDAVNAHTKSRYAKLENVAEKIRPVITDNGFSLTFGTEKCEIPNHIRMTLDVTHFQGHTERICGDFPLDDSGAKGTTNKTGIQATGSTYSYGRRYLTLLAFNVTVANEDNDGGSEDVITPDHFEIINKLVSAVQAKDPAWSFADFKKWLGIDTLEDMTPRQFAMAVGDLNARRNAK